MTGSTTIWRTTLVTILVALAIPGAAIAAPSSTATFPPVDGRWADPGPFAVTKQPGGSAHTIYRPTNLGQDGLDHPVIIWGNGTGATPDTYDALLRHFASHGFIVAAANTTQSGSGEQMLAGIDYLVAENGRPGSVFYGNVDTSQISATGHSQGGGGAISAGADPRVDTTIPIQPGPQGDIDALHGPMLILAGRLDFIVIPELLVLPRYQDADHIPAVYAELLTGTHFTPAGNGGGYRGPITAWLRFHLMGDEQARGVFFGANCGLCTDFPTWRVLRNALAQQVPGPYNRLSTEASRHRSSNR